MLANNDTGSGGLIQPLAKGMFRDPGSSDFAQRCERFWTSRRDEEKLKPREADGSFSMFLYGGTPRWMVYMCL